MMKFGDYVEEDWMATWLNQASTMHALGVDKLTKGRIHRHTGCDPTVGYRFAATGDGWVSRTTVFTVRTDQG